MQSDLRCASSYDSVSVANAPGVVVLRPRVDLEVRVSLVAEVLHETLDDLTVWRNALVAHECTN